MNITPRLRSPLARAALAALGAATLLAAAPAQAALIQGDWDPAYGAPFANLGWRGTSIINVPTACLALSGLVVNNGVSCALASVVSADVEFYDNATPLTTVETLDFLGSVTVDRFFVDAGVVRGFSLDPTARVASTSSLAVIPAFGTNAFFELDLEFAAFPVGPGFLVATGATLPWYQFASGGAAGGEGNGAVEVNVRTLPTPGTLGLAAAALLGALVLRRRA